MDVVVIADDIDVARGREAVEQRHRAQVAFVEVGPIGCAIYLPVLWAFDHQRAVSRCMLVDR